MTEISFKIHSESFIRRIRIDNWRFMADHPYPFNRETTCGVRLVLERSMIDIMGMTLEMTHKIIKEGKDIKHLIFTENILDIPGRCPECGGAGTIDWVSNVISNPVSTDRTNLFKRDERRLLIYHIRSVKNNPYFNQPHQKYDLKRFFAPSKVEDGFRRCRTCCGTGIYLDGRRTIFSGFNKLRYRLKEFEWDGLNLPTFSSKTK